MKVLNYIIMLVVILIGFNAFACPLCWFTGKSHAENKKVSNVSQCTLKVDGMTCEACVKAVEKALKNLDGVKDAKVSLNEETARVNYDSKKVKPSALVKAIENAGFKAKEIK